MFTLKLYQDGKMQIIECESVTVYDWENGSRQITAHYATQACGRAFSIGKPPHEHDDADVYDKAIVENAAGKTTEILSPLVGPQPGRRPRSLPVVAGDDYSARVV